MLSNSNTLIPGTSEDDFLHMEDYDANLDAEFVKQELVPYLKDLYKDLIMRSSNQQHIDKVTFIEYTKLPGIINDRLHFMFSNYKNSKSILGSPKSSPKEKLTIQKKDDFVTEQSFIKNFTALFIGDLD